MNPGCGWIAQFGQFRASMDEYLDSLLKNAQESSVGPTEAFLAAWSVVNTLEPDVRSGLVAAAVVRLAWENQP